MPQNLRRIYGFGHLHFITFSAYRRLPLLHSAEARNIFVQILGKVRDQHEFAVVGYVIMPEHVHLLIGEPKNRNPSAVMQALKQRVSVRLRSGTAQRLPQFWERRFYDFNVWSRKKKIEKLNYMHMNPVKRGLVERPQDWIWSSCQFYAGREPILIRMDPAD